MLSKLYHYKDPHGNQYSKADMDLAVSGLKDYFSQQGLTAKVSKKEDAEGTLGVLLSMKLEGKDMFVKTHRSGEAYQYNLKKEISIMKALYGDILNLHETEFPINGKATTFLIMDELKPLKKNLEITEINQLIERYSENLKKFIIKKKIKDFEQWIKGYSLSDIKSQAYKGLQTLAEKDLFSFNLKEEIDELLHQGMDESSSQQTILCHGDLSNKNIMEKDGNLIVIDWEDAIWGVEGYDLAYWLTFFDQRKYYNNDNWKTYHLGTSSNRYFMILIVLVKCYLSFLNGSYLRNTISFENRIREVMNLFG